MNRRRFLSFSALSLSLSGCTEISTIDSETDSPAPPQTTINSETATPRPSQTPERVHDLSLVNYTPTTEIATVRVLDGNGNAVVAGRYELPAERGIEFEDVGARETEYTVELTINGTELIPLTWFTASCESVDQAPRGSRNGYVRLRRDASDRLQVTLAVDGCDELIAPEYPTGPAGAFRLE
ncbi:hypothetical protein ACOZ4I_07175 [Haloarcula salina]|uniref:hypothetical protein n=1 Tax=Haloarcula salina TaxID=1429914 RepID=UPI003C6F34E1